MIGRHLSHFKNVCYISWNDCEGLLYLKLFFFVNCPSVYDLCTVDEVV